MGVLFSSSSTISLCCTLIPTDFVIYSSLHFRPRTYVRSAPCPFHYKGREWGGAPVRTGLWSGHIGLPVEMTDPVCSPLCGAAADFDVVFISPCESRNRGENGLCVHICWRKAETKWHKGKMWTLLSCISEASILFLWHISMTFNLTFNH